MDWPLTLLCPSKTKLNSNSAFLLNLYGQVNEMGGINLRN
jgi:hypothetical protein